MEQRSLETVTELFFREFHLDLTLNIFMFSGATMGLRSVLVVVEMGCSRSGDGFSTSFTPFCQLYCSIVTCIFSKNERR